LKPSDTAMESTRALRDGSRREQVPLRAVPAHLLRAFSSLFAADVPHARTNALTLGVLLGIVALGTAVRFWGLGAVGLHGDEETMAMPTMHIVAHGSPLLPSGMLYPRAVGQLYLMAASVMAFGQSEWALRLPATICGVLLILLAYQTGKRFLTPLWNLAFTASVAFLPEFIVDAQTARMYTFLVACVAGYVLLLFEWERTNRVGYLAAAVAVLILGIQFHTLAVFVAFLALYPGLLRGELSKTLLGALAFVAIVAGFVSIDHWIATHYPGAGEVAGSDGGAGGARAGEAVPHVGPLLLAMAAVGAGAVAALLVRRVNGRLAAVAAAVLIAGGLVAQLAFCYHVAALLLVAGVVIAQRHGGVTGRRLLPLATISLALAAFQIHLLHANGVDSLPQIFGAMTGRPSVWPYLVVAKYSVAAAVLMGGGIVAGLWRLAQGRRVPDHVLFSVLGVWIPLLLIGMFKWNVPLRYTAAQIFPLLLAAFATAQWFVARRRPDESDPAEAGDASTHWQAVAAIATCLLVVNPLALARTANSGYRDHPDHQGAAAFIRSLHLGPRDILIAEDVLQQTYYLGRVDYWLQAQDVAGPFVRKVDGTLEDFYTNTPLISSAEQLQALIARPDRGAIYVIGSGENQEDGRRYVRGPGMARMLESSQFEEVFRGRDGLTAVLKVPAPGQPQ
jgi:hypothetical protein